jgi:hypothetical protein
LLHHSSPYERLFNRAPNYSLLRVFGCKCFPLLRPYTNHKLEYRSKVCIFLGYSYAGYRCLDPLTDKVYLSRHVVFDDHVPAKDHALLKLSSKINAASDAPFMVLVSLPCPTSLPTLISLTNHDDLPTPVADSLTQTSTPSSPLISNSHPIEPNSEPLSVAPSPTISELPHSTTAPASEPTTVPSHSMVTPSHTGSLKPKSFTNFQLFYSTKHPPTAFLTTFSLPEPTCFSKAIIDPRWKIAMTQKFEALISNGTWTLCPRPLRHNVIRNKWVYKIKQHPDGTIDRFKACLVAKGFEQQCGVDYMDTFSPLLLGLSWPW